MNLFVAIMFFITIVMGFVLGLPYMLLMGLIVMIFGLVIRKNSTIAVPLVVGFVLRIIMVFLIHSNVIVEGDWDGYIVRALTWSENGLSGAIKNFTAGAYFYSWLASLVFAVFGGELTLFRLLNAFFSTLIILNVYNIAKNLHNDKSAKVVAWVMAIFPTAILHSSFFCNREPLIIYFFTAALLCFLRWMDELRARDFLIFFILYALTIVLHIGYIVGIAIILPYMIIKVIRVKKDYFIIFLYLLAFGALAFISLKSLNSGISAKLSMGGNGILQKLHFFSTSSSTGRANYLQSMVIDSYFDAVWQAPIRLIYFLLAPFPWMLDTLRDVYGAFDALFYLFVLVASLFYIKPLIKNKKALAVFIVTFSITVIFVFATGNYGTAMRHRAKFFPAYIAIFAPAMQHLWQKIRSIYKHSGH